MIPTEAKEVKIQQGLFDLATMDDVTLVKTGTFQPVRNVDEAIARLNNDSDKLVEVVNRGLLAEYQNALKKDNAIPWMVEDEDGNLKPFEGTPADQKTVNNLVLSLAKSVFGYSKDSDIEDKREAKENAKSMIRDTPAIRAGLQKQAAAAMAQSE